MIAFRSVAQIISLDVTKFSLIVSCDSILGIAIDSVLDVNRGAYPSQAIDRYQRPNSLSTLDPVPQELP